MYLIVGLGNPGREYEKTRHNVGFVAIDYLASQIGANISKIKFKGISMRNPFLFEKIHALWIGCFQMVCLRIRQSMV